MRILSVTGFLLGMGLLMAAQSCGPKKSGIVNPEAASNAMLLDLRCKKDEECTEIKADCCGCTQGGEQMAVLKAQAKNLLSKREVECQDMMCIQMISNHPSCKQKAYCLKGQCQLK